MSAARAGDSESPFATISASRAISRGVETFSSPRRAASRSIICRRRRVRGRPERVQPAVHGVQADAADEDVRGLVVGPADHQHGEVAPREAHAVAELLEDAAAAHSGDGRPRHLREVDPSLLGLAIELVEHGQLDRGRRREDLVGAQLDRGPGREVADVHPEDAVEPRVHRQHSRAELREEVGLLRREVRGRRRGARARRARARARASGRGRVTAASMPCRTSGCRWGR